MTIALCLGGAKGVWEEYDEARALCAGLPTITVACNFAGIQFDGHLAAWITLHPEMFDPWREERAALGRNTDYRAVVHARKKIASAVEVHKQTWNGSSGLYMAQVALELLGARGAILCGVPMEPEGGHIHWPGRWDFVNRYRPAFLEAKRKRAPIRSMGGWTAEHLGRPDRAWLESLPEPGAPIRRNQEDPAMRLKALHPINVSPKVRVRRGDVFEVSKELGDRYLRMKLAEPTKAKLTFNGADESRFDHDGDGKAGGSKPKAKAEPGAQA